LSETKSGTSLTVDPEFRCRSSGLRLLLDPRELDHAAARLILSKI